MNGEQRNPSGNNSFSWQEALSASRVEGQGSRVATYPVYGHWPDRMFDYRICTNQFPEEMTAQDRLDWDSAIQEAFKAWQYATAGGTSVALKESAGIRIRFFSGYCIDHWDVKLSASEQVLVGMDHTGFTALNLIRQKAQDSDEQFSEIRIVDPPTDLEILTSIYNFCVLGSNACVSSPQYETGAHGSTEIVSADVLFNWDNVRDYATNTPNNPTSLGGCIGLNDDDEVYLLTLHEAGHALGLSNAAIDENLQSEFNNFVESVFDALYVYSTANLLLLLTDLVLGTNLSIDGSAVDIPDVSEVVYETSHPAIADSVMNYDWKVDDLYGGRRVPTLGDRVYDEPNCWPHPLDIMAIHALYQQDY